MDINIFEEGLEKMVEELFSSSVPRYYEHTMKVVSNMKAILEEENVEDGRRSLLTAAAYLHDIGYSAPYEDDYVGNIKDQSIKIPMHCETGVEISRKVLSDLGMEEEMTKRVIHLVSVHHGSPEPDEDLKLLLEADNV